MLAMLAFVAGFLAKPPCRGDRGATAVEYALMVGLITAVIAGVVALFGAAVNGLFTTALNAF
jgi:pilus assembly protein Flp/PilA